MPDIRLASVSEIISLRHRILRPDTTLEGAYFDGDHDAAAVHLGAFDATDQTCCACATFLAVAHEATPAWQLRGMAVAESGRKLGLGRALLSFAERHLASASPVRLMWCHARKIAVPFYERCGWVVVGQEYELISIPHFKMIRRFGPEQA